jgi:hypothetical protein
MGQQSRLETIHAIYTFHLDNLGTPCCNGYQFFGCAAWRALRGCRLRLRGRGSWFLEGPYQQVPWTGRRIASVQSVAEQKWLVCGAQSCLLMYKHPGSIDIIFLYMFLLVHQGCWNDDVQLMVDFWILEWADSPCRGIHGSPDAVCQLAATSAQKLCHFWRHAVLQQNPSKRYNIVYIYIYYIEYIYVNIIDCYRLS